MELDCDTGERAFPLKPRKPEVEDKTSDYLRQRGSLFLPSGALENWGGVLSYAWGTRKTNPHLEKKVIKIGRQQKKHNQD